jgi:hypothetical protein
MAQAMGRINSVKDILDIPQEAILKWKNGDYWFELPDEDGNKEGMEVPLEKLEELEKEAAESMEETEDDHQENSD